MMKTIMTTLLLATLSLSAGEYKEYQKSLLLMSNGKWLKMNRMEADTPYYVSYPYKSTPTMLVKTEVADENNVTSEQLFAYLAINPNTYEYANNDVSVVWFYKDDPFGDDVLRFCDDKSTYAIETGHNVKESNTSRLPALSRVRLEFEGPDSRIYAVGVENSEVIEKFFTLKRDKLTKRFRSMWNAKIKYKKPRSRLYDDFALVTVRCNDILPPQPPEQNSTEENLSSDLNGSVLELLKTE